MKRQAEPNAFTAADGLSEVLLSPPWHRQTCKLWEDVFSEDSRRFVTAYYNGKGSANEISCLLYEGKPVSMIHWNPRRLCVNGHVADTFFIVGVATAERFRRQGMMARLLVNGLRRLYAQHVPLVFLTPANIRYYEPFGFAVTADRKTCRIRDVKEAFGSDGAFDVRPVNRPEYDALAKFVNECYRLSASVYVFRDARYYENLESELASEDGEILGVYRNGETDSLCGSVLYTRDGGVSLRDLTGTIPFEHPALAARFDECSEVMLQETVMMRIVSLRDFAALLKSETSFTMYIRLSDPHIIQNNGSFVLEIGPAGGSVRECTPGECGRCRPYTPGQLVQAFMQGVVLTEVV